MEMCIFLGHPVYMRTHSHEPPYISAHNSGTDSATHCLHIFTIAPGHPGNGFKHKTFGVVVGKGDTLFTFWQEGMLGWAGFGGRIGGWAKVRGLEKHFVTYFTAGHDAGGH